MDIIILFYTALALCVVTAISLVTAFISLITKKPKIEMSMGVLALIASASSFSIYYYLRIILSGGGFSDCRVVLVISVFVVAIILSIASVIDGNKKMKFYTRHK